MELLPCPFCGSDDLRLIEDSVNEYYKIHSKFIYCNCCGSRSKDTIWNTRHSPWISVNHRLPEITREKCSNDILMAVKIEGTAPFIEKGAFVEEDILTQIREWEVTHGMPISKLPEDNS